MNAEQIEQIVGRATPEEAEWLVVQALSALTDERMYEVLLATLTVEQIEELHAAMEQRRAVRS
jgi:hypothetical protein